LAVAQMLKLVRVADPDPDLFRRIRIRKIFNGSGSHPGYVKLYKQGQFFFYKWSFFTFSGELFHFSGKKNLHKKFENSDSLDPDPAGSATL